MPRKVAGSIGSERALARRITYERERQGWKQVALASRMTAAGCPMTQSAVSKIENDDPPRRITVDELVAFSTVFGVPVGELLLPPEVVADKALRSALEVWRRARAQESDARFKILDHVQAHPHVEGLLEELLTHEDRYAIVDSASAALRSAQRSGAYKGKTLSDARAAQEEIKMKGRGHGKHHPAP